MLAHRLRHRVTVQKPERTQDPVTGEVTITWVDVYASVPAEVLTGPGREFRESAALQGERVARINLRWFPNLEYDWRIVWEGEPYDIQSIEADVTARREYRLRCTAGVNDG
ncbi:MAG TPA: phage head closure protein [Arenicellales bacterium]|nr:phage head closure protein [Arenicellales bacterium]